MLLAENRWRAMRYSFDKGLIDLGRGNVIPCAELYEELIELVAEDAEALGCRNEIAHIRTILSRGTSAHRQLALHAKLMAAGQSADAAGYELVRRLAAESVPRSSS
jgi:carboxylate-amine ligase